jgi:DHA1 family multidrug resistance protein-like MFS transporter
MDTPVERQKPLWARPAVLGLLGIALFAELGVAVLNVSAMPVYLNSESGRGFATWVVGLVLGSFLVSEAVFKSFFGALADKHGRRPFLILAPCIWAVTPIATLLVPETWGSFAIVAMVLLRVVDGVAAAMLWPSAYAAVAEAVSDRERGKALSLLNVCFMVGLAFGLPLGGALNDLTRTLAASFYLASGLFLVTAVAAWLFARSQKRANVSDGSKHEEHSLRELLVCARTIPMILVTALVTFFGVGLPMAVVKLFAQHEFGLSESQFGALSLPAALAMAAFSLPLGTAGERMGRHKAVQLGLGLCAIGVICIALGYWLPAMKTVIGIAGGGLLVGIGFLLALPAWYATVSGINPSRAGSYLGAVMTVQGIGAIAGLALGARLYESEPYAPFIACAASVSLGFLLSLVSIRTPANVSAQRSEGTP